jgi:16S rRNA (cytosine967-C5)-methyltransferase
LLAAEFPCGDEFFKFFFHSCILSPQRLYYEDVKSESPREIAIRILRHRRSSQEYVEALLEQELAKVSMSKVDRALCQELVYGIVRWEMTLDWLIDRKTKARPQAFVVQLLLRLGLYQIFWLERIPAHAAVHETVELGKRLGCAGQSGFLNAVLRGFLREREATLRELEALKRADPALGYSHPAWLVEQWQERWGAEKVGRLLEWDNSPPPTYARVNTLKTDASALARLWEREGVGFAPRAWDWTGENGVFELRSHPSLAEWDGFQTGLFYIQDPSTLLAVRELNPQPGENILDQCAAPGGKTTYMAQVMGNCGKIVAYDSQPARLKRLAENCARLGASCVEVVETLPETGSSFDRILVDAPCSNSGVLRRRVDLRWRIRLEELERLREAQAMLLRREAALLKPGGRLVYSTCSLEPEENETVTNDFLREHAEFSLVSQRQLLPFTDGVDGAWVAALQKAG